MANESNTVNPPLGMSEFNADLKKESSEFYEKFQGTKSTENVFNSEQHFLDELKKHAPHLYEKLKKSNFKFKLDEKTKSEFASLVHQSEDILARLNAQIGADKDKDLKK